MKTLNKIALSVSMLLSIPAFAAEGFFAKAANKAQGFAKAAQEKVVNGLISVKKHPGYFVGGVAIGVLARTLYTSYQNAQVANKKAVAEATAQVQAKAELLTAVQNNQDATVAFNKLNDANKAVVQASFNAYNVALGQVKNAPTPKMQRRAQNALNQAKTAFVNAINTIKVEQVEETKTTAKDKAKALYATAKAKTKSAFATTKEFAKLAFAKVKEHKKKAIAATLAAALAACEGISYKKGNPYSLVNGFNNYRTKTRAKHAKMKAKRDFDAVVNDLKKAPTGYSEGTQE